MALQRPPRIGLAMLLWTGNPFHCCWADAGHWIMSQFKVDQTSPASFACGNTASLELSGPLVLLWFDPFREPEHQITLLLQKSWASLPDGTMFLRTIGHELFWYICSSWPAKLSPECLIGILQWQFLRALSAVFKWRSAQVFFTDFSIVS